MNQQTLGFEMPVGATETVQERRSVPAPTRLPHPPPFVVVTVYGLPAPQGSKRHVGKGILVESSKRVKPWRQDVVAAALEAKEDYGSIAGHVKVSIIFTMPKPASAHRGPKSKKPRAWPAGGDIDKLARSTLDALGRKKGAGLIEDDGRVVELNLAKRFVGEPDALDAPGAHIEITGMV